MMLILYSGLNFGVDDAKQEDFIYFLKLFSDEATFKLFWQVNHVILLSGTCKTKTFCPKTCLNKLGMEFY